MRAWWDENPTVDKLRQAVSTILSLALVGAILYYSDAFTGTYFANVDRYCEYGAVSQAQLDGCKAHVTLDDIQGRNTNAARFAEGDLHKCLADAGPFCVP